MIQERTINNWKKRRFIKTLAVTIIQILKVMKSLIFIMKKEKYLAQILKINLTKLLYLMESDLNLYNLMSHRLGVNRRISVKITLLLNR